MRPTAPVSRIFLGTLLLVAACGGDPVVPEPNTITISPASVTLQSLGETVQLTASVKDRDGRTISGVTVTWAAGDESAAAVDGTGRVTAVGNGMAIVEASAEGVSGFSQVWVEQWAVQVQVSPEKVTLGEVGDTIRLLAEATDANGYVIEGAKFAWSSDRPAVTVDTDGLVTAVGNGLVWVYAAIGRRARGRAIIEVQLDRGVLLKLYEAMGGADWNRNQNWGTDAPFGTWYGVRGGGSDVSGLALRGNGLTGSIPPETADLKLLNLLALEGNSITGPIPAGIGNQPRLAVIVVSDNRLSGPIPSEFGNLGQLRILRVNDTLLSGQLPLELIGLPLEVFTRDGTDLTTRSFRSG